MSIVVLYYFIGCLFYTYISTYIRLYTFTTKIVYVFSVDAFYRAPCRQRFLEIQYDDLLVPVFVRYQQK